MQYLIRKAGNRRYFLTCITSGIWTQFVQLTWSKHKIWVNSSTKTQFCLLFLLDTFQQNVLQESSDTIKRSCTKDHHKSHRTHWQSKTTSVHPPAPSGPKFNGSVFTAAPVFRFIFTHSNRFKLLVALTSKPPSENELAEVSYVCSQPSCHPTELQPSF